jgi:predicted O-methyltransferase YrrM
MFREDITDDYITNIYSNEPQDIKVIRESCPEGLKRMQMHYNECRILSLCLKSIKANKVLELGTLVGCSTAWIAKSLSGDRPFVISIEKSLQHYEIAKKNIDQYILKERIQLVYGECLDFLKSTEIIFDAIFIDAKKTEYPEYLREAKRCLRSGGLIIADNTLMIDYKQIPEISNAINEFNYLIENDTELTSALIPTRSGMTIAIKN